MDETGELDAHDQVPNHSAKSRVSPLVDRIDLGLGGEPARNEQSRPAQGLRRHGRRDAPEQCLRLTAAPKALKAPKLPSGLQATRPDILHIKV